MHETFSLHETFSIGLAITSKTLAVHHKYAHEGKHINIIIEAMYTPIMRTGTIDMSYHNNVHSVVTMSLVN